MDRFNRIRNAIGPFVPLGTADLLAKEIVQCKCHLTITRERKTKLGDYRHPHGKRGHRISVNGTLNQYAFLITFVHELSHLICWERHGNKVRPHGKEWKAVFKEQMQPYLQETIFPMDILEPLSKHMTDPKSATVRDVVLMRALRAHDAQTDHLMLEQLPENARFRLGNKEFLKGPKLRKRYRCKDLRSARVYLVSAIAEVLPLD